MARTRSRKTPRSVAKRRVKSRKSQNAKRLKTQKRKSRIMKGGGGDAKVYIITKNVSQENPVPTDEYQNVNFPLLQLPMCYIIRESVTIRDPIYLLFKDNCTIDEIKEIVRIVLGLDSVEKIPKELLDAISKVNGKSAEDGKRADLLKIKFKKQISDNENYETTFKSLFIKIHGYVLSGLKYKYKYISTKTLSTDDTKLEINNIKPERDYELTEQEQDSTQTADDIISRLSRAYSRTPYLFPLLDEGIKKPLHLTLGQNKGTISDIHGDIIFRPADVLAKHVFTQEDRESIKQVLEQQQRWKKEKEKSDEAVKEREIASRRWFNGR
jgi:hypothetical protein